LRERRERHDPTTEARTNGNRHANLRRTVH
jgi:hypothetical protein